jgi:hypothetical protein
MQESGLVHLGSCSPGDRRRLASPIRLPAALARNFRRAVTLSRHGLPSGQLALPWTNHRPRQARCPTTKPCCPSKPSGSIPLDRNFRARALRVTAAFRLRPKRMHECPGVIEELQLLTESLSAGGRGAAFASSCRASMTRLTSSLSLHGFFDEVESALLERRDGHRHVAVAGKERSPAVCCHARQADQKALARSSRPCGCRAGCSRAVRGLQAARKSSAEG